MNSHAPAADSPDLFWEQIGQAAFDREADVEQRLLEPLLRALGYQSTDIRAKPAVRFQTGRAGRSHEADYIVYQGPINDRTTSLIVVEAKPPRDALGDALKQAESYAFNVRAPFLILANGRSLEIWQLQPTKESIKVLSCNISELNSHRGRIEALVGRDAAIAHCRALHLKELPSATGMFAPYIVSAIG